MAKSKLVRPSYVCLKLCDGDVIAATLLAEIFFKANVTHYNNKRGKVIVFSLEEWAEITGMSIGQVRKALERIEKLNLIQRYNKKHPHKTVLRALHVEVSHELWELYDSITAGRYEFKGDALILKENKFQLSVSSWCRASSGHTGMPTSSTFNMVTDSTVVCAQGADVYNKKENKNGTKDDLKAAAHNCATGHQPYQVKEKVVDSDKNKKQGENYFTESLKDVASLPILLMALHHQYMKYFWDYIDDVTEDDFHAMTTLTNCMEKHYGKDVLSVRDETVAALFVLLRQELGDERYQLIQHVSEYWDLFCSRIKQHYPFDVPKTPNVEFFYYFREYAKGLTTEFKKSKTTEAAHYG